jgi:hypothetical protein
MSRSSIPLSDAPPSPRGLLPLASVLLLAYGISLLGLLLPPRPTSFAWHWILPLRSCRTPSCPFSPSPWFGSRPGSWPMTRRWSAPGVASAGERPPPPWVSSCWFPCRSVPPGTASLPSQTRERRSRRPPCSAWHPIARPSRPPPLPPICALVCRLCRRRPCRWPDNNCCSPWPKLRCVCSAGSSGNGGGTALGPPAPRPAGGIAGLWLWLAVRACLQPSPGVSEPERGPGDARPGRRGRIQEAEYWEQIQAEGEPSEEDQRIT